MSTQFICGFEDRRLLIQQPSVVLNGIDFVEVLDEAAPAGTPRQQTLVVRLFRPLPAGFDFTRVRIDGGVRIPVHVMWAQPAATVGAPGVSAAEAAIYAALPEAARTMIVRTDANGDFSTYRLVIAPATDFDPVLSSVELYFKAECPTQFDCGDTPACPPTVEVAPAIDYLVKDFASFRRSMFDRLSALVPRWRERNVADVGVMLVEVLAYRADQLSYFQDSVGTEAYLGTARRRISVRRHARLVDYAMHEGCNARAWLHLAASADDVVIRAATIQFATRCKAPAVISPSAFPEIFERDKPEVFAPLHDIALYTAHDQIAFYTWGQRSCCLPAGATRATLRETGDRLRLRAGDVLVFEAVKGASTGRAVDADLTMRCAVRLTRVTPEATLAGDGVTRIAAAQTLDPLTGTSYVEIEWQAEDALEAPACISSSDADGRPIEDVTVARGNIVVVDHGRTIAPRQLDVLPPADATRYRPRLRDTDIVHAAPYDPHAAASASLVTDPVRATAAVSLSDPDATWRVRPTLLDSDRFDRDFVVEIDDRRRAILRFGDGVLGREPAEGIPLVVTYRVGTPAAGNVGAEAIAHAITSSAGIAAVRNPLAAVGGVDPESIDAVKIAAPQAFRTQKRAVTEADYAEIAERHPEVQKAVATRRWTGSWYTMFITVDRKGGAPVDSAFAATMRTFVETYRLAGHDLEIESPVFVALDLALPVCVAPGYLAAHVLRALRDRFSNRINSDGTMGMFHPDRWTFGQPVYLSQIVEAAMDVPGVGWIDMTNPGARFQRWGETPNGELGNGVIEMGRFEIARLDNSASLPENGRLAIAFLGGSS